jgi:hypothetical protein
MPRGVAVVVLGSLDPVHSRQKLGNGSLARKGLGEFYKAGEEAKIGGWAAFGAPYLRKGEG